MEKYTVIADNCPNASDIIVEAEAYIALLRELVEATAEFKPGAGSLGKYFAQQTLKLKDKFIEDFGMAYASLATFIVNGAGKDVANHRLTQSVYGFKNAQKIIADNKFLLRDQTIAAKVRGLLVAALQDAIAFLLLQFDLWKVEENTVFRAVEEYWTLSGMGPAYMTLLLDSFNSVGGQFLAYEEPSPVYAEMQRSYAAFLSECEENMWDITTERAKRLLNGDITIDSLRRELTSELPEIHDSGSITPTALAGSMNLFG